jgi:hypothetical protein
MNVRLRVLGIGPAAPTASATPSISGAGELNVMGAMVLAWRVKRILDALVAAQHANDPNFRLVIDILEGKGSASQDIATNKFPSAISPEPRARPLGGLRWLALSCAKPSRQAV